MLRVFALFFLSVVLFSGPAKAGEWTQLDKKDYSDCDYRFSGPINNGDLTGLLDRVGEDAWKLRICLDSPGGSLGEVLRFSERVNNGEASVVVGTRIEAGRSCLSSCALLFMFGQDFGANSPYPSRQMERGARLGFHSPFVSPEALDRGQGSQAFQLALKVSQLLVDQSYKALTTAGAALPRELVAIVLRTPADSMYYVETIGEMELLGIERWSQEPPIKLANDRATVMRTLQRICDSSHVLSNREHFVKEGYDFKDLTTSINELSKSTSVEWHKFTYRKEDSTGPSRFIGVLSGNHHVPGWNSAGAALFCRAEIFAKQNGDHFVVDGYGAQFSSLIDLDEASLSARFDGGKRPRFLAGLTPVDTAY